MQLSLFETIEFPPGKWMPSYWNEDTWYYEDEIGYSTQDQYGRNKHLGTMLPQIIQNNDKMDKQYKTRRT